MNVTLESVLANIEAEVAQAERLPDAADDLTSQMLVLAPLKDEKGTEINPNVWHDQAGNYFPGYYVKSLGYVYTVVFRRLQLQGADRVAHAAVMLAKAALALEPSHAIRPVSH